MCAQGLALGVGGCAPALGALCARSVGALRGFSLHGRGGVTLSGKVLITYTDACTKHKQEARHGRQRGDDSHKSQVALTPAELAPDVQQYDEGDEQQAQHEDGCRATAQREPQPLRTGVASAGGAAVHSCKSLTLV